METAQLEAVIILDEFEKPTRYKAVITVLGRQQYNALRKWCLKRYRSERYTPLLAFIDCAGAHVAITENEATRQKNRPWKRRTRFMWTAHKSAPGTEQLHTALQSDLFREFTKTAAIHGWTSADTCIKALVQSVIEGRGRKSRA